MPSAHPARSFIYEACVESLADALAAEKRGAHRIELCSALDQDGLTPSRELIGRCRRELSIPIMAMTEPTPMTTPSIVKTDLSLLLEMDRSALSKQSPIFIFRILLVLLLLRRCLRYWLAIGLGRLGS